MNIWGNCKRNMLFLRKRFGFSQTEMANLLGISRGPYQYSEDKKPSAVLDKLVDFWYLNYGITPNHLLLTNITDDMLKTLKPPRKIKLKARIK